MKNKIIYFLLLVIVIEGLFIVFSPRLNLSNIRNDSGWDTDYDGGWDSGDWDSGDWDSGDWDSGSGGSTSWGDYSYDDEDEEYDTYHGSLSQFLMVVFFYMAVVTLVVFVMYSMAKKYVERNVVDSINNYNDIDEEYLLSLLGIDSFDELKEELFRVFVDIQNAWMEFDYKALAKLCGDELYNSYKSDLEVLKLKNGKNIMSDYEKNSLTIYNYNHNAKYIELNVCLSASFYDYVIDTKSDHVIRGDKNTLITNNYLLVFKKNFTQLKECPSCGAKIKESNNTTCEYCNAVIVNSSSNWVLISKEKI